jgi:hypothetical protein
MMQALEMNTMSAGFQSQVGWGEGVCAAVPIEVGSMGSPDD